MSSVSLGDLKPRKSPRQARSTATVDAIFEATVQVLLTEGSRRLTTTRVAARAGVSVGTMYQYFPNKHALLHAVLQRHLNMVAQAVEAACARSQGEPVATVASCLVAAYINAKTANLDASCALYFVSADFDISSLVDDTSKRILDATATALAGSSDAKFDDLPAVAFAMPAALTGAVRVMFEHEAMSAGVGSMRVELVKMCKAYLQAAMRNETALVNGARSQMGSMPGSAR